MVAEKSKQITGDTMLDILEHMSKDSVFLEKMLNAKNVEEVLHESGFPKLDFETINDLQEVCKTIKKSVNIRIEQVSMKVMQMIPRASDNCNGVGW